MWHRRRERRITPRRRERFFRQRRMIVGVDDVVRQARVFRMLLEERLENRRRLQLLNVLLVCCERGLVDRKGIENPPLHVSRILRDQPLHALFVRERPRPLRRCGGVGEQFRRGRDVCALSRCRRPGTRRALDCRAPELNLLRRTEPGKGISPAAERDAPVGDGTGGVFGGDTLECRDRLCEPERMQERDGTVEVLPQRRRARRHEADVRAAGQIVAASGVFVLAGGRERRNRESQRQKCGNHLHINLRISMAAIGAVPYHMLRSFPATLTRGLPAERGWPLSSTSSGQVTVSSFTMTAAVRNRLFAPYTCRSPFFGWLVT